MSEPKVPLARWRERLRGLMGRRKPDQLRETIEEMIEESSPGPAVNPQELVLLRNSIKLRELTAYDVMVPRVDIVAVKVEADLVQLVETFTREAHSRMPVYRDSLDDAFGMVHVKDILRYFGRPADFKFDEVVRKVLFIAPSMRLMDLLLEMRKTRLHMALVVDEYGGVDGLVTIEDVVEEIVGDIEDEYDVDEGPRLVTESETSWLADARVSIADFEARIGPLLLDEERNEADIDTLGGWLAHKTGRVPGRGEVIADPRGFEFEVLEADPRRVRRVRVRRKTAPAPTA